MNTQTQTEIMQEIARSVKAADRARMEMFMAEALANLADAVRRIDWDTLPGTTNDKFRSVRGCTSTAEKLLAQWHKTFTNGTEG